MSGTNGRVYASGEMAVTGDEAWVRDGQRTIVDAVSQKHLPSFSEMSSQQRSASMDATVQQVAALSVHHNLMAATIRQQGEEIAVLKARVESTDRHVALFITRRLMARLRWIMRGAR